LKPPKAAIPEHRDKGEEPVRKSFNISEKRVMLGIPGVILFTTGVVLALWAWGPVGDRPSTSTAGVSWNVEYWHRTAEGRVLEHKRTSNAIVASGLEHAMERLIAGNQSDVNLAFTTPVTGAVGESNAFDQIVLMGTDDAASNGLAAADILLLVDGGNGDNDNQAAGGAKYNPADGAYSNVGTTSDGDGKVTLKFLADGNPVAATQMHLVKRAPYNTADGAALIVAADILATLEISVDLADTDTLTIEWTIDLD
jgi:hypothetical protein